MRRSARGLDPGRGTPRRLVLPLALATALLGGVPALAHSGLERATPGDREVLAAPPAAVELTFGRPLVSADVVVTGPGGDVTAGEPAVRDRDVRQALRAGGDGEYRVAFRVLADDGHATTGTLAFRVAAPTTGPAPAPTAVPTGSPGAADAAASAPAGAGTPRDSPGLVVPVLVGSLLVGAAGTALVVLRRRRRVGR